MENEEKILNPEESLRIIRETIDLAKSRLRENGFQFLLWGWLVIIACVADYYLAVVLQTGKHSLVWLIMVVVGMPVSWIYEARREKKQHARNVVRDWYGQIWLAFFISLCVGIFSCVAKGLSPVPFILVLIGFATFVSGTVLRFPPLILGSVAMWAGALLCSWLPAEQHLLVQAGATVLGYLVPGYLLNARSRHV